METIKEMIAFIFVLDRDTFANEQRVKWIKVIYMIYRVLMSILCIITLIIMVGCFVIGTDYLLHGNIQTGLKLIFSGLLLVIGTYILFFRKKNKLK